MKNFELQLEKERDLYRELFIKTEKTFKELIHKMKLDFSCINCGVCCKIRYSQFPPKEIFRLANEENDKLSKEYIKLFVPYGADKDFNYIKEICLKTNNDLAKEVDSAYVEKILSKHDMPVYFYYCRDLTENCANREKNILCKNFPSSITTILPESCCYKHWQNLIVHRIENEIAPDVTLKIQEIIDYRNKFSCKKTGTCCRLASSEFSYGELQEKAKNNDDFAKQFVSIFVPYKNIEEARKVFPEYIDLLISRLGGKEKLNFFYCKHLQGKNICPIYESRPQICRDFPDNPLSALPPVCGFCEWKEEVTVAAHTFHAMSQIYSFYLEKIKNTLNNK